MHGHWTTGVVIELLCSYWTNQKKKMQKWPENSWLMKILFHYPSLVFPNPFPTEMNLSQCPSKRGRKADDDRSDKATGQNFAFCTYK